MPVYANVPSQCGMKILHDLGSYEDLDEQIDHLEDALGSKYPDVAQVIITDAVVEEKKRWAETKKLAFKGPSTINPNSDRAIRVYIVTEKTLVALKKLRASLERKARAKKKK